jgi:hypothetical protein
MATVDARSTALAVVLLTINDGRSPKSVTLSVDEAEMLRGQLSVAITEAKNRTVVGNSPVNP